MTRKIAAALLAFGLAFGFAGRPAHADTFTATYSERARRPA